MAFLTCHFFAESLGMCTSMNVLLPEPAGGQIGMGGAKTDRPPPVLYLLHGLSDDHTIWMRRTSIERYCAELGLAVVMPNVHRSFYRDMAYGYPYWTFLHEELPRRVASFFCVSDRREDTFVAGLSMGGYGAFRWALNEPGRFAAAASLSGALDIRTRLHESDSADDLESISWFGDPPALQDGDDLFEQVEQRAAAGEALPALYVACGTEDFLYDENTRFKECLEAHDVPFVWDTGDGAHDWAYWDDAIQRVLKWLPLGGPA